MKKRMDGHKKHSFHFWLNGGRLEEKFLFVSNVDFFHWVVSSIKHVEAWSVYSCKGQVHTASARECQDSCDLQEWTQNG